MCIGWTKSSSVPASVRPVRRTSPTTCGARSMPPVLMADRAHSIHPSLATTKSSGSQPCRKISASTSPSSRDAWAVRWLTTTRLPTAHCSTSRLRPAQATAPWSITSPKSETSDGNSNFMATSFARVTGHGAALSTSRTTTRRCSPSPVTNIPTQPTATS